MFTLVLLANDMILHNMYLTNKSFYFSTNFHYYFNVVFARGDRGAVWFGFEYKYHPNREIKMHVVRFGSVDF
jgi:hypothetical protein